MSLAKQCLRDPQTRKHVVHQISIVIKKEMKVMASDNAGSIMRSQSIEDMKGFTWKKALDDLALHAPTLLYLLESLTETKTERSNREAVIVVCSSLLFKHRYQYMSRVQKIVSLIFTLGTLPRRLLGYNYVVLVVLEAKL